MHTASFNGLIADRSLWLRLLAGTGKAAAWIVKDVLLFAGLLALVTAAAAVIGCLFLSNGEIAYLIHPNELFNFIYHVRAGLKATVLFVTCMLFFLCINERI